ncbi:hypothetical protein F511_39428 [Dorcoceras hygrometricum]|uniref:Uncharacterized protein n=1 Tax=Dorcoceras hygrometricum TaxID=472368 RepID=A0A2Z7BGK2_9LAMI|nr:hypothetical protein F511_39428 [Dorcoceras hygrometricum]
MHTSWRSNSDITSVTRQTHLPKTHPVLWPEIYHTIVSSDNIGYPRMKASGESSTTKHRLLHASGPHPIPPPNDPNWLLLLATGFACEWLLLLVTGFACDWLLLFVVIVIRIKISPKRRRINTYATKHAANNQIPALTNFTNNETSVIRKQQRIVRRTTKYAGNHANVQRPDFTTNQTDLTLNAKQRRVVSRHKHALFRLLNTSDSDFSHEQISHNKSIDLTPNSKRFHPIETRYSKQSISRRDQKIINQTLLKILKSEI